MNPSVILVCAPFLSVVRPALGVSNIKAALESSGVQTSIEYLNIQFANRIGVDAHEDIAEKSSPVLMIGEWIFSESISKQNDQSQEAYFRYLSQFYSEAQLLKIRSLRESAREFVDCEARRLVALRPSIIGFSSIFQQNCASLALAARVRELNPDITICFGGANCEGPMGLALIETFPQIDYVFSGEAEYTFPEFVQRFLAGTPPFTSSLSVYSRFKKDSPPMFVLTGLGTAPESKTVVEMDELPTPDFSDYFRTIETISFRDRVVPGLLFETSRGCWWGAKTHCKFCGLNGSAMTYRTKSPGRVLKELEELYNTWSVPRFEAVDNIMDMKHVETIFGVLGQQQADYRFFYETKSNMNSEQLSRIAQGGVTWIQPGIESLHDEILQLMGKGVTGLQNIRLLRNCMEVGIQPLWNILHGFPGERPDQYKWMADVIPLLEHLDPPNGLSQIRLDRFSPYLERAEELGFTNVRPIFAYEAVYALAPDTLSALAYFFDGDCNFNYDEDYVAPLRLAISHWRQRVFEQDEPPMLSMLKIGSIVVVKDTRSCALERWRCLSADQVRMLNAFRDPKKIEAALGRLKDDRPEPVDFLEIFDQLVSWNYILVDKDRALCLVTETIDEIHGPQSRAEYPGGWLDESDKAARISFIGASNKKNDGLFNPRPLESGGNE